MTDKDDEPHVCVLNPPARIYLATGCYLVDAGEEVEFDKIDHESLGWDTVRDEGCEPGYVSEALYEQCHKERLRLTLALEKINNIRNSIVGLQTVNWSEHIYPLVAELNKAGFEGMGYPEAMAYFGDALHRAVKAEAEAERLREELELYSQKRAKHRADIYSAMEEAGYRERSYGELRLNYVVVVPGSKYRENDALAVVEYLLATLKAQQERPVTACPLCYREYRDLDPGGRCKTRGTSGDGGIYYCPGQVKRLGNEHVREALDSVNRVLQDQERRARGGFFTNHHLSFIYELRRALGPFATGDPLVKPKEADLSLDDLREGYV